MKLLVTGASGQIGRSIVPRLIAAGAQITVVGRDPDVLARLFPTCRVATYDTLWSGATRFDLLVHLAVANTDSKASLEQARAVNVDLTLRLARAARDACIARFLNVSSVHALDLANTSPYAVSKREAEAGLAGIDGIDIRTIYLAAVHGDTFGGSLKPLAALPAVLARLVFVMLAAFKPTVHVDRVAEEVLRFAGGNAGHQTILADDQDANPVYRTVRRVADLCFALGVLMVLNWALLLIWLAVRLESPGPGLFAQQRVGRHGKVFTCYKFRSMRQGTRQAGTHEVPASAVTPIGRFLRRTKLDELPQVVNLLRNEMSLIGPRPCLPVQTALIEARRRRGVLAIKPGISGLAQINDIDMSDPERLAEWDARYLALRGLLLDLKIALATATGRGRGDRTQARGDLHSRTSA